MRTALPRPLLALAISAIVAGCGSTASTASIPVPASTGSEASTGPTAEASPSTPMAGPSATPSGSNPSAAPSASPGGPATADWPVYHLDPGHSGDAANFPAWSGTLTKAWSVKLDGAVYAEPLVVNGMVIVATEGDSLYALAPATGKVLWSRKLGTPVPLSTLPCGDIDPLGITGTPAYDPATRTVFAVAEVKGPAHILFALDPASGAIRWSRNVDLAGHTPRNHQQRPALAAGNGYVYIGFGGLAGDCAQYEGEVVGVPTSGTGSTISYTVPVKREGAVWASGGPVFDDAGNLYVSTGNGSSTTTYDGSDSSPGSPPLNGLRTTPRTETSGRWRPFWSRAGGSSSPARAAPDTSCARATWAASVIRSRRRRSAAPSAARRGPGRPSSSPARPSCAQSLSGPTARSTSAGGPAPPVVRRSSAGASSGPQAADACTLSTPRPARRRRASRLGRYPISSARPCGTAWSSSGRCPECSRSRPDSTPPDGLSAASIGGDTRWLE